MCYYLSVSHNTPVIVTVLLSLVAHDRSNYEVEGLRQFRVRDINDGALSLINTKILGILLQMSTWEEMVFICLSAISFILYFWGSSNFNSFAHR